MSNLSNETIKRLALYSGFTAKEGGDLRSYVYEFARAIENTAIARMKQENDGWSVSFPSLVGDKSAERWSDTSEATKLKRAINRERGWLMTKRALALRKIQSVIDSGEYREMKGATVLVNEEGCTAIVSKGGAFYWVDNDSMAREWGLAGEGDG